MLLHTEHDVSPLILRITLGLVMLPHGAKKMLGWFGGPGFAGKMAYFTQNLGIPYLFGVLAIIAEFEYHLLVLGMVIVLMMAGGGAFSVDRKIAENRVTSFHE